MIPAAGQGFPAHTLNNANLGTMGTPALDAFSFHQPNLPCSISLVTSRKSFQIAHDKFIFSFPDDLLLSGLGVVLGTYGLWVLTLQEPDLLEEEGPCL